MLVEWMNTIMLSVEYGISVFKYMTLSRLNIWQIWWNSDCCYSLIFMIVNVIIVNKRKDLLELASYLNYTQRNQAFQTVCFTSLKTVWVSLTARSNAAGNVRPGRGSRNLSGVDFLLNFMPVLLFVPVHTWRLGSFCCGWNIPYLMHSTAAPRWMRNSNRVSPANRTRRHCVAKAFSHKEGC